MRSKPNNSSMLSIMEKITSFISCKFSIYRIGPKPNSTENMSIVIAGINKLGFLVNYFNKYPRLSD